MRKRRFGEYSLPGKLVLLVVIAISVVIVGSAERDISRRDDEELRGSRTAWRLLSLNALGALTYLRFGRRR